MKKALITGIAGQDGSYLAELLLDKGYEVHGIIRSTTNLENNNLANVKDKIKLHYGDLTDSMSIRSIIDQTQPDEVYNLAAQSNITVSLHMPELTTNVNAMGPLRILDAIKNSGRKKEIRYFQASTSDLFSLANNNIINEQTVPTPSSPYGISKLYAHLITKNYRDSFGIFACNGIFFNHESPRRSQIFVTRKITKAFANIAAGKQKVLELGNLDNLRDWGYSKDYVRAAWMLLQHDTPEDFVISTGVLRTIRDFCNLTADCFGIKLVWEGVDINEVGRNSQTGEVMVRVNPDFYRPINVQAMHGDSSKIREILQWNPEYSLQDLVHDMCKVDMELV